MTQIVEAGLALDLNRASPATCSVRGTVNGTLMVYPVTRLGMGWGLLPEIEIGDDLDRETLRTMAPKSFVDVPLRLAGKQWRYGAAILDGVASAIQDAARVLDCRRKGGCRISATSG